MPYNIDLRSCVRRSVFVYICIIIHIIVYHHLLKDLHLCQAEQLMVAYAEGLVEACDK